MDQAKLTQANVWLQSWREKVLALGKTYRRLGAEKSESACPQLKMFRPIDPTEPLEDALPAGYGYLASHEGAHHAWIQLINDSREFLNLDTWSKATLQRTILSGLLPGGAVLVTHGSGLVGCVGLCRDRRDRKAGVVMYLLVHPDHRGRGLARSMMQRLLRICQANRLTALTLLTDEYRLGAIALYLHTGFLPVIGDKADSQSRWSQALKRLTSSEAAVRKAS